MKDLLERLLRIAENNEDSHYADYPKSVISAVERQIGDVLANLEVELKSAVKDEHEANQLLDDAWHQIDAVVAGGVANDDIMQKEWTWESGDAGSMKDVVGGITDLVNDVKKDLADRFGDDEMKRIFDAAWEMISQYMDE